MYSIFSNSLCVFQGVKGSTDTYDKRLSYFTTATLESLKLQKFWIHLRVNKKYIQEILH